MRILGIDLGSTSIKAVELDSAFGRYEIHDYYEHPVDAGTDLLAALTRLMQALPKEPDRIAIALRSSQVTFRNLRLPTRDKKAIQAGVGYELEDELPFASEKMAFDYSVLEQGKQGSHVHVAATLKPYLAGTIDAWAQAGIQPDLITTESWAYRTLLTRVLSEQEQTEPVMLVQIGHEHTSVYVHWNGVPIIAREILWGGRDLTQAIGNKYRLPPDQAEQAKLDHGFVIPFGQAGNATPEQVEFSETLLASLQGLLVELRQVELTCKSLTHHTLSRIYLSGGTILLPGLVKVIEESLRLPTQPLLALSSIATSGVTYSEHTDAVFLLAAATALCYIDRGAQVNFRKGEFSKVGKQREISIESIQKPLIAVGASLGCVLLSLVVQQQSYSSRLKDVDQQLERGIKGFYGAISPSAVKTYLSSPTLLKSSIDKEISKQRDLARLTSLNPHDPLDFLNTLSSAIPKDVVTDLMNYQVGSSPSSTYSMDAPESANLTFYVANPGLADRLNSILSGKISGLSRGRTEEVTASDGSKQWKVTFSGRPNFEKVGD